MKNEQTSKERPIKSLTEGSHRKKGRSKGKITSRRRGGGAKRLYRTVEFGQSSYGQAEVLSVEYDPNRTTNNILVRYDDGREEYRIAYSEAKAGDKIEIGEDVPSEKGNRMRIGNIPVSSRVYNVEFVPGEGGKMMRSAGTTAEIMGREGKYVILKMPSKEIRKVHEGCFATIGQPSNPEHRFGKIGKAGRARHMGRRPKVRGTAMPAGPHPHGGGEGKTSIGLKHPKTFKGKLARGGKTRRRKHTDKYIIKNRREAKKK